MNSTAEIESTAQPTPPASPRLRYVPKPKGSWMKLVGRAKNDDLSLSAFKLGEEWREQMNREGH
jgi:hypothetical protein